MTKPASRLVAKLMELVNKASLREYTHTHRQREEEEKVIREDYYGFVDLIGRVGSH
jgi:hypothetical protein